jgi:hypothetical protein
MDGDGEHIPEDILPLIDPILNRKAHSVIGTRFDDNRFLRFFSKKSFGSYSQNRKKLNLLRRFGNWLFSLSIWIATGVWIIDSLSGFRAFAPRVLQNLELCCKGFQIETEMTMELINNRYKIEHVPIQTGFVERPSYMGIVKDSIKIIATIIRTKLPNKLSKRLIEAFPILIKR